MIALQLDQLQLRDREKTLFLDERAAGQQRGNSFDFARAHLGGGIDVELTDVEYINSGLMVVVQELRDAQPGCEIVSSISVSRSGRCDLGRIQQVASNLLSNALTHGQPHNPIKIMVRADASDLVLELQPCAIQNPCTHERARRTDVLSLQS